MVSKVNKLMDHCHSTLNRTTLPGIFFFGIVLLSASAHALNIHKLYGHGLTKRSSTIDELLRMYGHSGEGKRAKPACPPIKPFTCPGYSDICLPLQYICDGSPDCPDGYDEDVKVCTAAVRPPVDEIIDFLKHLIKENGQGFLAKLFGQKAVEALKPRGGIEKVAIALSESKTADDFGRVLHLLTSDVEHLRNVMAAVEKGNLGLLREMGIKESALGDTKFFLDKLVETGFMSRQ